MNRQQQENLSSRSLALIETLRIATDHPDLVLTSEHSNCLFEQLAENIETLSAILRDFQTPAATALTDYEAKLPATNDEQLTVTVTLNRTQYASILQADEYSIDELEVDAVASLSQLLATIKNKVAL